ncbi:MAG: hypothetical protein HFK02_05780 [Clostridia bacterium]|nr:hypothetical protein [Clostridia bacterium]
MKKIKNIMLCLLAAGLMGNMITPVYTMAKESPAPSDLYSSYVPGEEKLEENDIDTEDALDFKGTQIKNKPKISAKNRRSIQKICGYFSDYLGYSVGRQKAGKSVSLNFNKQKNRKKVLGFMPDLLFAWGLEDAAEFVFGKKASGAIKVYHVDWGENKNIIKIKNIEAKRGKKYEAKFDLIYYDSLNNVKTKFANGVFYLKKTGKNDFVVAKLEVKKEKDMLLTR